MNKKYKILEDEQNELKEKLSKIEKDISAFANTDGGTIHIGVDDNGDIKPVDFNNKIHSQIVDAINNVEPRPDFRITHENEKDSTISKDQYLILSILEQHPNGLNSNLISK